MSCQLDYSYNQTQLLSSQNNSSQQHQRGCQPATAAAFAVAVVVAASNRSRRNSSAASQSVPLPRFGSGSALRLSCGRPAGTAVVGATPARQRVRGSGPPSEFRLEQTSEISWQCFSAEAGGRLLA